MRYQIKDYYNQHLNVVYSFKNFKEKREKIFLNCKNPYGCRIKWNFKTNQIVLNY